jgi:3-hydroxyacyl-CoA dehydrogenase/enoyl-CoA hydratase/3-hydroxybutyryl-CoA epimerase
LWTGLCARQFPPAAQQPEAAALVERFLIVQAVEAAKCVEEGRDPRRGHRRRRRRAARLGLRALDGRARCRYIDTLGADLFVAKADALADQLGDRLRPGAALRGMAARGERFHSRG